MTEKGMIFTAWSVGRILAGAKTRTMRPMQLQPIYHAEHIWSWSKQIKGVDTGVQWQNGDNPTDLLCEFAPYKVGDSLWIREAWRTDKGFNYMRPTVLPETAPVWFESQSPYHYLPLQNSEVGRLRPGMFLPKRFAWPVRLPVIAVKVQRPRDLTLEEIWDEGIRVVPAYNRPDAWKQKWVEIYGERSWEANLWCFIYEWTVRGEGGSFGSQNSLLPGVGNQNAHWPEDLHR